MDNNSVEARMLNKGIGPCHTVEEEGNAYVMAGEMVIAECATTAEAEMIVDALNSHFDPIEEEEDEEEEFDGEALADRVAELEQEKADLVEALSKTSKWLDALRSDLDITWEKAVEALPEESK